jgi:FkbM family methyltransferase
MRAFCLENGVPAKKIISHKVEFIMGEYYAQYGEDIIVENIFKILQIANPRYLDIGCNHPIYSSNTFFFYWNLNSGPGICVDANPEIVKLVKEARPADTALCFGVADCEGSMDFFTHSLNSAIGRFDYDSLLKADKQFEVSEEIVTYQVPVITLQKLVDDHCGREGIPELLSIDVEGYEMKVLNSARPEVFESNIVMVIEKPPAIMISDFAKRNGYFLYASTPGNYIFVKEKYRLALLPF